MLANLPDQRTGKNTSYTMEDFALSAASVFFTQSPLAQQETMQLARDKNNAQSLFRIEKIPSDSQVRQVLDPVPPQRLYPVYDQAYPSSPRRVHNT